MENEEEYFYTVFLAKDRAIDNPYDVARPEVTVYKEPMNFEEEPSELPFDKMSFRDLYRLYIGAVEKNSDVFASSKAKDLLIKEIDSRINIEDVPLLMTMEQKRRGSNLSLDDAMKTFNNLSNVRTVYFVVRENAKMFSDKEYTVDAMKDTAREIVAYSNNSNIL